MNYTQLIKTIALQEGCSPKEIEKEMKKALNTAGITCSPKTFLKQTAFHFKQQTAQSSTTSEANPPAD